MNTEQLMPAEILIKDKKSTLKGKVIRAAIYSSSKVIHVQTTNDDDFYLIYYRNSFIYGNKLEIVELGSFIDKAFNDGLVIEPSHPLLTKITPKQSVSILNQSKLFSNLQLHFSHQELAYIATTLDSFFEKEYLGKVIDQIYFHYRRDGKFFKAFQILQLLTAFMPQLISAKERIASLEFNSYHNFYQSSKLSDIYKKDPLYVELYCFKNRLNPDKRLVLEEIWKSKECLVEVILLWLEKVREDQKVDSIETYSGIAQKILTTNEWISILCRLKINPFHKLPEAKALIDVMIKEGKFQTAAAYLFQFINDLPASFDITIKKVWENLDAEFVLSHINEFIYIFKRHIIDEDQEQFDSQIYQIIVNMLKESDLKAVYNKLLPLQKELPHSVLIKKLGKMVELMEDPDRMMELGSYYADFRQYDQAIDCYFWEMELKPQDPEPVWNLSKMYQHKGMLEEATAYQKVFTQLKNIQ